MPTLLTPVPLLAFISWSNERQDRSYFLSEIWKMTRVLVGVVLMC